MGIRWPTAPPRLAKGSYRSMASGQYPLVAFEARGEDFMTTPDKTLTAALSYAARGWAVIPLHGIKDGKCSCGRAGCGDSAGKHPRARDWPTAATTDPATIRGWWKRWPDANVGIATGRRSGLLVLDIDPRHGGDISLEDLIHEHGTFPATPEVITGSGGRHIYFKYPPGGTYGNSAGKLGPGLDTRGDGGLIVAPPSTHRSGRAYCWELSSDPADVPLAEPPDWLLELLAEQPRPEDKAHTDDKTDPPGNGNVKAAFLAMLKLPVRSDESDGSGRLLAAARQCVRYGLSDPEALATIRAYATAHPFPRAYNDSEITRRLADARKRTEHGEALAEPTPAAAAPEYIPFPVNLLPDPLRRLVIEGAEAMRCPPEYFALPTLAICGSLIGNTRRVVIKRSWTEPPILWVCLVGQSGTLKTPAMREVAKPLRALQTRLFKEHAKAMAEYEIVRAVYERDLAAWRKNPRSQGDPPPEPEAPLCRRFIVSDCTLEALGPVLLANPTGVLLLRDELNSWLSSFGRYAKNGKGDSSAWLEMYGGEAITIDRRTGVPPLLYIPSAAVSVCGSIQPGTLDRAMGQEFRESGLMARLLLSYPPRAPKRWTEETISPATESDWANLIERLARLKPGVNASGEPAPQRIRLGPEAKEMFVGFYSEHNAEAQTLDEDLARPWAKLECTAPRLSLIFNEVMAAQAESDPLVIGGDAMRRAIGITQWWCGETKRVYSLLESAPEDSDRAAVLRIIQKNGGGVTVRQLQQAGGRRFPRAEDAEAALMKLASTGLGVWTFDDHNGGRGRGTRVFKLTPPEARLHKCQKSKEFGISVSVDSVDSPQVQPEPSQTTGEYAPDDDGPEADTDAPPGWDDSEIAPDLLGEALDV